MSNDAERWKNKYLAKLEETEKTEQRLGEQLHLLERVVVRVSLAAEGVDPGLDRELDSLRVLLRREDHGVRELSQQLEQIERRVLALDENKAGVADGFLDALQRLVDVLADGVDSRDLRKQLKQYGKSLRQRVQEIREYPTLLSEYGEILAAALRETGEQHASHAAPREGFFSRLFSSRGRDAGSPEEPVQQDDAVGGSGSAAEVLPRAAPGDANVGRHAGASSVREEGGLGDVAYELQTDVQHGSGATEPTTDPGQPDLTQPNQARPDRTRPDQTQPAGDAPDPDAAGTRTSTPAADAGETAADPQGNLGFSRIADRVQATLANLVEQLALPATMDRPRDALKGRIQTGLNWYELVPTLDDVAFLVIAAVGRGQQEFEAFLKSVDERLAGLQALLSHSHASHRAARTHGAALESLVRERVGSLHSDVRSADDLESLKHSVESNLDTIIHSLDEFVRKEAERESSLSEQMEILQVRLRELEAESGAIKQRLQEETRRAMTDVLTGLPNRVAYGYRVEEEYARWKRYGRPLSLVVADIDFFKRINDSYGHLAGDRVLQLIGKEVATRIRTTDFLARYGGEELVVLMPETPREVARAVMDKTREMISRLPFHFRNQKVQITMSFGISEFHGQDSIDSVFERADQALYQAKAEGRNRVQVDPG